MAEMRFRGVYKAGDGYEERNVGFHSRNVVYYAATNDPEITAVVLSKEGVKEIMYVCCSASDFFLEKSKAERDDMFLLPIQLN